jgi:hypothetical protein
MKDLLDTWYERSQQIAPVRIRTLTRCGLIVQFVQHGLLNGAEIGVDRGRFSEFILKLHPDMHMLLVDPWRWKLRGQSRYESTLRRMEPFGDRARIDRRYSFEAVMDVPDESLDWVYIDGDHTFDYVMTDLIWWARKVRYGGVVAGHDYYRHRGAGVVAAVDVYTQQHGITKWFLTDEKEASFFWVREPYLFNIVQE